jgi:hypothetical protein
MGKLLPERSMLMQAIRDLSLRIAGVDQKPAKKKFSLFG